MFCFTFLFSVGYSQQVPFYNNNIINPFIYNPAQAGQTGDLNTYLVRNERYNTFGNSAINNYLSIEGDFFVPNSGFGLVISNFSHGIQQQINGQFSYSYGLKINDNNDLKLGLAVGYLENHLNNSAIDVSQQQDPYLEGLRGAAATYDFNFGVSYRFKNSRLGISIPQLIGNNVKFQEQNNRGYYALARHFMGTLEHDFFLLDDKLKLKPHLLARYIPGAPLQYDATLHADYLPVGWISATYKSDYAVQFNLGFRILSRLSVGYSYEYIFGSLNNYFSGVNHEFMLGYTIPSPKEKEIENAKLTAENEKLRRKINQQSDTLNKEKELVEALQKQLKEKIESEAENDKDTLAEQTKDPYGFDAEELKKRESEIRDDTYYNFIELDGAKAAKGYYIISGVFSEKKNANKRIGKVQVDFPDASLVKNTANGYYYVVVNLTQSKKEGFISMDIYKESNPNESVWILRYNK